MQGGDIWWSYWYYHLGNYILAALMYTMVGRFGLGFIVGQDSPNYIWRWFRRLTDPVMGPVSFITPAYVAPQYLPLIAAYWLALARLAYYLLIYSLGLAPTLTPGGGG
ncbi:MAG: YggT family protein [Planctomycetota bacterium]